MNNFSWSDPNVVKSGARLMQLVGSRMVKTIRCILWSALAMLAYASVAQTAVTRLALIPQPLQVEQGTGAVVIGDGTPIVYRAGDAAEKFDAEQLARLVAQCRGLVLHPQTSAVTAKRVSIELERTGNVRASEAYVVTVSAGRVVISAASDAGLYYGVVTLWQMMTSNVAEHGDVRLGAVTIHDQPQLRWRGIMVDSARHMQPIEFLHQLIDWMSLEKLNTLHWHLTDDQGWRLEIKRYPLLTTIGAWRAWPDAPHSGQVYGGFYSQDQVRELVAYAGRRNVMIVPEIEMPGHATAAIAAYPELASAPGTPISPTNHYGVFANLYSPTDATYMFLENVLTEVMELFPSLYIHVGGDEAVKDQWKASPAIQAQMKADGVATEEELQGEFMKRISRFLSSHGRRMVGWDEILGGGLAANATVMSWHGVSGGIEAARQNHDAVLTPVRPLYFDFRQTDATSETAGRYGDNSLADVYRFDPLPASLSEEERGHILGIQANVWSEYLVSDDRIARMIFPRAAAVAEVVWSPARNRGWTSFLDRMPAELARYQALGVPHDPDAFLVQSEESTSGFDAKDVRVSLRNQVSFGALRYTTDGSTVTPTSALYSGPMRESMPLHLRAAAFVGDTEIPGSGMNRTMDDATLRRKSSQQLQPCADDPVIAMEKDPPSLSREVFVVNYRNPCWIEKGAWLNGAAAITLQMQALPWVFEDGPQRTAVLPPVRTAYGEIEVHLDRCDGSMIALLPLPASTEGAEAATLHAALPALGGQHDLCIEVHRPKLDPLWALNWVQVDEKEAR